MVLQRTDHRIVTNASQGLTPNASVPGAVALGSVSRMDVRKARSQPRRTKMHFAMDSSTATSVSSHIRTKLGHR